MTPSEMTMRVELLGPLRVQIDGEECEIVGPMRRQLIALLALHPGQSFSTDRLTELLWDGEPPASAASSLRVHVAQLRRALGDPGLLERTDTGYRLAIEPENIDLVKFESHIRMGRAALSDGDLASAREALGCARDLWRGVPFSDVRVGSAVDVERLFSLRSELSVDLAEVAMRSEGARANTSELSALTVERPFDERVWSLLITALYWSGRQSEALETYLRAITALRDELGVDPTPRLRRLQEQILHHDPALDPPRNAQVDLPTFPTSFVGRESEVSEIAELLRTHRIVTLTGLGGVGKTRLSVAAAEHAGSNFDHGVIFVSLASLEDESLVCTTVAGALGARATTARELAATIEHRKLLLVLDNCEHLLTTITSLISELCERCPRLRILATSRIPLNLVGECVWVTPTLDRSTGDGAHPDSVNLFLERAAQADPHSNLPAPDSPLMIEIAELLGGVPLAIELTAARCNILTVADIAVRLRTAMSATARETDRPDRHSSMEVVIEGTLRHLSPQAQLLLARLPLFLGPVGIEALSLIHI